MDSAALQALLTERGVVTGILTDVVAQTAANPQYSVPILVAAALEPVAGVPGRVQYHFPRSREARPQLLPNGSVDYKQLGLIHNVRAGDVLCTKIPATPGTPGMDVTGQPIAPKQAAEAVLPVGKNTSISQDGLCLLAATDGQVDQVNRSVCVQNVFEVSENVDLSTGNIHFLGNVVVKGNVFSGFEVNAEGNVTVKGCLEGGVIKAGGNVVIQEGVNGKNVGRVEAEGDIRCKYVQNATLVSFLNIETGMCINSTIQAGGNVRIVGAHAGILSSRITARNSIECRDIGSATATQESILEVGSDPHNLLRMDTLPKEITAVQKNLGDLERLITYFEALKAQNRLREDQPTKLLQMLATRAAQQEKLVALQMELTDVEQRMTTAGYGTVNVLGSAYAGTRIVIGPENLQIHSEYKYTQFSRSPEKGIVTSPAKG